MHTIQGRVTVFLQEVGCAHIGGQHAFFDDPVRVVTCFRHNPFDFALIVKNDAGFVTFKINRATLRPRLEQGAEKFFQVFKRGNKLTNQGFGCFACYGARVI